MMASRQSQGLNANPELPISRGWAKECRLLYLAHFGEDQTAHLEAGREVGVIAALQ